MQYMDLTVWYLSLVNINEQKILIFLPSQYPSLQRFAEFVFNSFLQGFMPIIENFVSFPNEHHQLLQPVSIRSEIFYSFHDSSLSQSCMKWLISIVNQDRLLQPNNIQHCEAGIHRKCEYHLELPLQHVGVKSNHIIWGKTNQLITSQLSTLPRFQTLSSNRLTEIRRWKIANII